MTKRIVGVVAAAALMSSGMALAGGNKEYKTQSTEQVGGQATGGSGASAQHMGAQKGQMLGEKETSGTVVKSSGSELKLRTEQGIISLKVDKNTQFQDASVKKIKDIKEGQQVRTSFTVEKDTNLARSVSLDSGMGGSGLETDPGLNQDINHQDMGGSGLDATHQDLGHDMGSGATHQDGKTY